MTSYMLSSALIHCKHVIMINYHESKCRNDFYIIQIVFSDLRSIHVNENNENSDSNLYHHIRRHINIFESPKYYKLKLNLNFSRRDLVEASIPKEIHEDLMILDRFTGIELKHEFIPRK